MAPAAKKSRTSAGTVGGGAAGSGSLKRMFGGQAAAPAGSSPGLAVATSPSKAQDATVGDKAPNKLFEEPSDAANPANAEASAAAKSENTTSSSPDASQTSEASQKPSLSLDQKKRIEEMRQLALEKRQAKQQCAAAAVPAAADAAEAKTPAAGEQPSSPGAPAAAQAASPAKPAFSWPSTKGKAESKAEPKAAAKAKAKAKAGSQGMLFAKTPEASPAKKAQSTPNVAQSTPEKVSQDKGASPSPVAQCAPRAPVRGAQAPASRFETVKCDGWNQYFSLYATRLKQLRGPVQQEARTLWGGMVSAEGFRSNISGFQQVGEREVVVFGVLFKDMKGRPKVIDQYKENKLSGYKQFGLQDSAAAAAAQEPGAFCTDEDTLWLEDASMRLQLVLPSDQLERLTTGFVTGVKGVATAAGTLSVTGLIFARLPPPPALPQVTPGVTEGPFLALISGSAEDDSTESKVKEARGRLFEFLASKSSGVEVKRLLVCGGALCDRHLSPGERLSKEALSATDEFLARMAGLVQVDVMPGRNDPTNMSLPQMPLHPHLFRSARKGAEGSFRCVSNPHALTMDGCSVLGHSGQPVQDFLRCTRGTTALGALQSCLEGLHLAPTAPDTLAMPPVGQQDPFVIQEVPNVFFSGGHARAEHQWLPAPRGESDSSGTQLLCVPSLRSHPAVVLVSMRDPRDVRVHELAT